MNPTESAVAAWRGATAVDHDGEKIGTIDEIYADAETDKPEWLAVKTGLLGSKLSFIPIAEASETGGRRPGALRQPAGQGRPGRRARRRALTGRGSQPLPPLRVGLFGGPLGLRAAPRQRP